MFSPTPSRSRTSLAPSTNALSLPSASSSVSGGPTSGRYSAHANLSAVRFLPRHTITSAFNGGLFGGGASGIKGGNFLESHLTCMTGSGGSSGSSSQLQLRAILSSEEIDRMESDRKMAAADDDTGAAIDLTTPIDPAPVLASMSLKHHGDVEAIECLSDRLVVAAMADGTLAMVEITAGESHASAPQSAFLRRTGIHSPNSANDLTLQTVHTFEPATPIAASSLAVSLSSNTPLLASCYGDGTFRLFSPFTRRLLHTVRAHSSSLETILFSSPNMLHTAGMGGQITSWDVRALNETSNKAGQVRPSSVLVSPHGVSISSMSHHPLRPFNLACGSSNGTLTIFDLRSSSRPLCTIQAQRAKISQLSFVEWKPSAIIAASEDGSICEFDFAQEKASVSDGLMTNSSQREVEFSMEEAKSHMRPTKLYQHHSGVNDITMDRQSRTIIAAADGHSLLFIKNPTHPSGIGSNTTGRLF